MNAAVEPIKVALEAAPKWSKRPGTMSRADELLAASFTMREASITLDLPYVLKHIIAPEQLVVIWGAPGSGKSFNLTEILAAVDAGVVWNGHRTRRCVALYVCAEGARAAVMNRLAALKRERPEFASADVVVVPVGVDLLHAERGDVDAVIEVCKRVAAKRGAVGLIGIDTLAMTFGGGVENATEDMSQYVINLRQIIQATGAAVLVVHHAGKEEARGMRGNSALLGALDAELVVEKPDALGMRVLRTGKVRDGESDKDLFLFKLRPVHLGTDPDGDPVTTCVVEVDPDSTGKLTTARRGARLRGKNQKTLFQLLEARGGSMSVTELREQARNLKMSANRITEALQGLYDLGAVENLNGLLRVH